MTELVRVSSMATPWNVDCEMVTKGPSTNARCELVPAPMSKLECDTLIVEAWPNTAPMKLLAEMSWSRHVELVQVTADMLAAPTNRTP